MITYETELMHHGVKGMKWGVRRYENPNGSLTAEGKKHVKNYRKYNSLKNEAWKHDDNYEILSRNATGPGKDKYINKLAEKSLKADAALRKFKKQNRSSIRKGRKLDARAGSDRANYDISKTKQHLATTGAAFAALGSTIAFVKSHNRKKLSTLVGVNQGEGRRFVAGLGLAGLSYGLIKKAEKYQQNANTYRDKHNKKNKNNYYNRIHEI